MLAKKVAQLHFQEGPWAFVFRWIDVDVVKVFSLETN